MVHQFTKENIDAIANVLETKAKPLGNDVFRLEVVNEEENRRLALEIHLGLEVKGKNSNMVSVYAQNTFLQLHNCTAFIASDMLQQVTFFGRQNERTSGLIVETGAGCSLYANVSEMILNSDFTKLPEDLMMSAIALSLTESVDLDDFSFDED
ncbi:hypothetical protein CK503_00115 [Aliifodinibius salipaludis]|uniref:Uncharacterized protein n=1 Tax=Fodinibius salipaludis TaxID=2032627 RepID=A0A2A2GF60_9BACT|nr:hypothetical protein [Aliifodinibius salipaludis]PAU95505.1 hypothetical protein CK503_00115 [Aliifodinibius salipaludis]